MSVVFCVCVRSCAFVPRWHPPARIEIYAGILCLLSHKPVDATQHLSPLSRARSLVYNKLGPKGGDALAEGLARVTRRCNHRVRRLWLEPAPECSIPCQRPALTEKLMGRFL